jgi:PAS domain S-box-containing protein
MEDATNYNILVVDDDYSTAYAIKNLLEVEGYQSVESVFSGNEALEFLKTHRVDLILLDIMMEGMSGYEVCKIVKGDEKLKEISIVFLSAKGSVEDKTKGLDLGASDYVSKPFDSSELLARVKAVLRERTLQRKLATSETRYKILIETLNEGVIAIDENMNVSYVNPYLEKMLEGTRDEIIGKNFSIFVDEKSKETVSKQFAGLSEGKSTNFEMEFRSKRGNRIPVMVRSTPYYIDGAFAGAFQIVLDLTEQKNLEKKKRELEQARSNLIAMIVHDLKNPIASIYGFSELLLKGLAGQIAEKPKDYLNHILHDSERVLELVNEMLDLSKLEAGQMKFQIISIELFTALTPSIEKFKSIALEKGITLVINFPEGLPKVNVDPDKVNRILVNLLSNAVKHTKGGKITVDAEKFLYKGKYFIKVGVKDTGEGIPAKDLPFIFEPYRQSDTGSMKKGGTGLGLTIVKRFVEAHGGNVFVESKIGVGSTFSFTIPASQ